MRHSTTPKPPEPIQPLSTQVLIKMRQQNRLTSSNRQSNNSEPYLHTYHSRITKIPVPQVQDQEYLFAVYDWLQNESGINSRKSVL